MHIYNVYKPAAKKPSHLENDRYVAILPGVEVTYQNQDNDSVIILQIKPDQTYIKLQEAEKNQGCGELRNKVENGQPSL